MKKIYNIAAGLLIAASLTSCENYFDVNTDPNNPLVENLSPDLVLPGSMMTTGAMQVTTMNRLGNLMVANWSANVVTGTAFSDEFTYNVSATFYDDIFNTLMRRTVNYTNIINHNSGGVNYSNHKAIARILKAYSFQYLVDLYGDIPYFNIHQGTDNLSPAYDDAQLVYNDLINELNIAITSINAPENANAETVGSSDIMLGGNMQNWVKFANTIKLRILMRQSDMTDATVQTLINDELNGMTAADFINFDVTFNPGYANDSANGRQNNFYGVYGYDANDNPTLTHRFITATPWALSLLDGTLASTADPRLSELWTNGGSPNDYQGIEQGDLLSNLPNGTTTVPTRLGEGLGVATANDEGATRDDFLMIASESFFLQAEAIHKGYMGGDVTVMFNSGIAASMNTLGATPGTYANDIALDPSFGIAGGNPLKAIAMQKFLALTSINGIEAWIEYTRTGYPDNLPTSLIDNGAGGQAAGTRPVRLLYPQSEISGNSANVPPQAVSDAFTNKIFWDVN